MTSILQWEGLGTADSVTWSPALASLANNAQSLSTAVDNRTDGFTHGFLQLVFGSAVTLGSTPSVSVSVLEALNGVNYASPATAGAGPPSLIDATYQGAPGASVTVLAFRPFKIRPVLFKLLIGNALGNPFAATVTANFYRSGYQST